MDYRVRISLIAMLTHLSGELDAPRIAESAGVSCSELRVLFKRDLGHTPCRFLKRLRLERARHLLCAKPLSVKEVCGQVGYRDQSHFVRDFARAYGQSPRRYRREFFGRVPVPTNARYGQ